MKIIISILIVFSSTANAALIDNGDYTTDTISGLDWLDLSFTEGLSYNDVSDGLAYGDEPQGWRMAKLAEAQNLFEQFGFPVDDLFNTELTPEYSDAFNTMVSYIGTNLGTGSYSGAYAFVDGYTQVECLQVYGCQNFSSSIWVYKRGENGIDIDTDGFNFTPIDDTIGALMVRDPVSVPLPASVWLFASALVGMAGLKRKK